LPVDFGSSVAIYYWYATGIYKVKHSYTQTAAPAGTAETTFYVALAPVPKVTVTEKMQGVGCDLSPGDCDIH
jgi:hypothetical protein